MKIIKEKRKKTEFSKQPSARNTSTIDLIGPKEGSEKILMRLCRIGPGGQTALHAHSWEHVVRIERGEGVIYSPQKGKFKIAVGQCVYIPPNEEHQFTNPYPETLEMICVGLL